MLLLAYSVGRMGYLQRCLPPAALLEVAQRWDGLMVDTVQRVMDLAAHELTESIKEALQRPRRLGGFWFVLCCVALTLCFHCFCCGVGRTAGQSPAVGRYAARHVAVAPVASCGTHFTHCQHTAAAIRHTASVDC